MCMHVYHKCADDIRIEKRVLDGKCSEPLSHLSIRLLITYIGYKNYKHSVRPNLYVLWSFIYVHVHSTHMWLYAWSPGYALGLSSAGTIYFVFEAPE